MKLALFAIILVFGFLLFGCLGMEGLGGNEGTASSGQSNELAASPSTTAPAPGGASDGKYITKEGFVTVKVAEGTLNAKFEDMKGKLKNDGAELGDIRYNEYSDRREYTIAVKVLPSRFEAVLADLQTLGEVKDLSVNLEDVTKQYRDLDTRITNSEIELQRLQALYNRASKVSELLDIEREITRVETDLELLKQEKSDLISRVEKSTITITLYEDMPATNQLTIPLEGMAGLFFGAMGTAVMLLVGLIGFLLPGAILLGLLWFVWKKLKGRGSKPRKPEHDRIPPPQ